jgi:hypothetical protein
VIGYYWPYMNDVYYFGRYVTARSVLRIRSFIVKERKEISLREDKPDDKDKYHVHAYTWLVGFHIRVYDKMTYPSTRPIPFEPEMRRSRKLQRQGL